MGKLLTFYTMWLGMGWKNSNFDTELWQQTTSMELLMYYTLKMEQDKDLLFRIGKMFQSFEKVGLSEFKSPTSLVSINILLGKI